MILWRFGRLGPAVRHPPRAIGAGWINATDPKTGKRRLDNPNDFVRIEVREALKRDSRCAVPGDGASIPEADDWPDDLKMWSAATLSL